MGGARAGLCRGGASPGLPSRLACTALATVSRISSHTVKETCHLWDQVLLSHAINRTNWIRIAQMTCLWVWSVISDINGAIFSPWNDVLLLSPTRSYGKFCSNHDRSLNAIGSNRTAIHAAVMPGSFYHSGKRAMLRPISSKYCSVHSFLAVVGRRYYKKKSWKVRQE